MGNPDDDLLSKAVAGDRDALSALLSRYGPQIRAGLRIGATWQAVLDPDDVMQVTYIEAFIRIRKFAPNGIASFVSWLERIAEHNLQDAIKGLSAQKRPSPRMQVRASPAAEDSAAELYELAATDSSTPSRMAGRREKSLIIDEALKKLPPDYQAVLRLYDLAGQPMEDVAKLLGKSCGAVFMIRARAVERLREILPEASALLSR